MFHPIGTRPPAVYWRRRVVLCAALVGLMLLTAWVLRPGDDKKQVADPTATHSVGHPASTVPVSTPAHPTGSPSTHTSTKPGRHSGSSHPAAPAACKASALKVAAAVDKSSYSVGDQPVVRLQVTNKGSAPCVQNLADSQVELRVYNGESRVWGSHDCTIQPGVSDRTLAVRQPVLVSIVWSGLSSQPKCVGTRQRVGAGTYTLYALLSGHEGSAAQFTIS